MESAIIDIGSNTVRLVLYGGAARAPVVLFNEKVTARLGRDLARTGLLADEAMAMAMQALRRFALLLRELGVEKVEVVATAAVRDATNGADFLADVAALGFAPRLLSGEEEAHLAAMGVAGAFPVASGLVADLGGGSLELVTIRNGNVSKGNSLPLGTLRLPGFSQEDDAATIAALRTELSAARPELPDGGALYCVGGALRAMAIWEIEQSGAPVTDPHGFALDAAAARALARRVAAAPIDNLAHYERISASRAETMPAAANLLIAMIDQFRPAHVIFSAWGLREGTLFSGLPSAVRRQDPLLAGLGEFATMRGCPPRLATQVAAWTAAAAGDAGPGSERLRQAATMLALASMQIEPNMRVTQAMDWALKKRWIGIDPAERALLAAAVAANGKHCDLPPEVASLASADRLAAAQCWGLAVRLCRRLGARAPGVFSVSALQVSDGHLLLSIEESHAALFSAPAQADLDLLASRMGLKPHFQTVSTLQQLT